MNRLLILLSLMAMACSKQGDDTPVPINVTHGVYIGNEGNFMYGNASLSLYNVDTKEVYNQIFIGTNGFPLGDVLQSMIVIGDRGFMVVNNSGKVVVVQAATCRYIATIKGLTSPRYIQKVGDRLYVSDLYGGAIAVVDPSTYTVTGHIRVGASTEQMVSYGNFVYACSWSFGNKVYKIDTRTDTVVDSVQVTKQPNSMVMDRNDKLWVLSDGAYKGSPYGEEDAALTRIDAATLGVEQVISFADHTLAPSEIAINSTRDTLYYISGGANFSNGVFRMDVSGTALPTDAFIPADGALFYALGVDWRLGDIYVSDAIDYMQRGTVFRYSPRGEKLDSFKVDIIPGSFCFF